MRKLADLRRVVVPKKVEHLVHNVKLPGVEELQVRLPPIDGDGPDVRPAPFDDSGGPFSFHLSAGRKQSSWRGSELKLLVGGSRYRLPVERIGEEVAKEKELVQLG